MDDAGADAGRDGSSGSLAHDNGGSNDRSGDSSSSCSSDGGGPSQRRLTAEDGLSAETLRALRAFRLGDVRRGAAYAAAANEGMENEDGGGGTEGGMGGGEDSWDDSSAAAMAAAAASSKSSNNNSKALCVAYTANDSLVIAQTLKRLQERAEKDSRRSMEDVVMPDVRDIPSLLDPTTTTMVGTRAIGSELSDDAAAPMPDDVKVQGYLQALQRDGVVRIDHVLAPDTCELCLELVNRSLDDDGSSGAAAAATAATAAAAAAAATKSHPADSNRKDEEEPLPGPLSPTAPEPTASYGYGNVFSRTNRYDMYLHPSDDVYAGALRELLHHEASHLGRLVQRLLVEKVSSSMATPSTCDDDEPAPPSSSSCEAEVDDGRLASSLYRNGKECYFHEFSCLVSDPGSKHQPLHPDYTGLPPLFTVFVALQNVTTQMGPTVLVPTSHAFPNAGEMMRAVNLSDPLSYRQATLQRGDCIVMDSRTYHMGSGNTSSSEEKEELEEDGAPGRDGKGALGSEVGQRRALLYLTLRDPDHASGDKDFPPNGSLFDYLKGHMKLSDYDGTRIDVTAH